jgi:hypothetical protein
VDLNSHSICEKAAELGHFEILKWLREEGWPWDASECLSYAEESEMRNEEMIRWIKSFVDYSSDEDFSDTDEDDWIDDYQSIGPLLVRRSERAEAPSDELEELAVSDLVKVTILVQHAGGGSFWVEVDDFWVCECCQKRQVKGKIASRTVQNNPPVPETPLSAGGMKVSFPEDCIQECVLLSNRQ